MTTASTNFDDHKHLLKGDYYERHGDPDVGLMGTITVEEDEEGKVSATVNINSEDNS